MHVHWDGVKNSNTIENGTLSIEIPLDTEKRDVAETKLKAKLNETIKYVASKNRKKRSLQSGGTGIPVVQIKVS